MITVLKPIVPILAVVTLACATGARAQYQQDSQGQPSGPSDAQNWQERERHERERQQDTQQQWDKYNQGQEQYQQDIYRQQQQQGSRRAASGSGGGPDCAVALARIRSLAPLANKVNLGHVDERRSPLFDIKTGPTAAEKPLLRRWVEERRACAASTPDPTSASWRLAESKWGGEVTNAMIFQLIAGKLTYGQFNQQRASNSIARSRYLATH